MKAKIISIMLISMMIFSGILIFIPHNANATPIFNWTFESGTDGFVQTTGTIIQVGDHHNGSHCLYVQGSNAVGYNSLSGIGSSGITIDMYFYGSPSSADTNYLLDLCASIGSNERMIIIINNNILEYKDSSGTVQTLQNYGVNTWHHLYFSVYDNYNHFKYSYDGGALSSEFTNIGQEGSKPTKWYCQLLTSNGYFELDDITINDNAPTVTTWQPTITSIHETTAYFGVLYSYHILANESYSTFINVAPNWLSLSNNYLNGTNNGISDDDLISIGVTSINGTLTAYDNFDIFSYNYYQINGKYFSAGGNNISAGGLWGIDETTALEYALAYYCNNGTTYSHYLGQNQNFPNPGGFINTSGYAPSTRLNNFWNKYFTYCNYFNVKIVRMGAFDQWGTHLMDGASDSNALYNQALNIMLNSAWNHSVAIEIVLAGDRPDITGTFGGPNYFGDSVFDLNKNTGHEYWYYLNYVNKTIGYIQHKPALFSIDCWNEPDSNPANTHAWNNDIDLFNSWAKSISGNITPMTNNIIDMGTATLGNLFHWGESNFNLSTGTTGFDTVHRHYYASANDSYLVTDPIKWANDANKPYIIGELGYNKNYPEIRWIWYENQAISHGVQVIISLTLRGTNGYPHQLNINDIYGQNNTIINNEPIILNSLYIYNSNGINSLVYPHNYIQIGNVTLTEIDFTFYVLQNYTSDNSVILPQILTGKFILTNTLQTQTYNLTLYQISSFSNATYDEFVYKLTSNLPGFIYSLNTTINFSISNSTTTLKSWLIYVNNPQNNTIPPIIIVDTSSAIMLFLPLIAILMFMGIPTALSIKIKRQDDNTIQWILIAVPIMIILLFIISATVQYL